ncbi:MAG: helix-turn-helix transcriptional regulator [Ferruginibacter sp.]
MLIIKEIRVKTGISQYKLAEWLGISRSLVKLAEKGERSLPHNALMKLMAMQQGLGQVKADNTVEDNQSKYAKELASHHKRKMEIHQYKATGAKLKLKKLEKLQASTQTRYALTDILSKADSKGFSKTAYDQKWIEFTKWFAAGKISKDQLLKLAMLKDKMDTELAYAEVHRKLYEKYQLLSS